MVRRGREGVNNCHSQRITWSTAVIRSALFGIIACLIDVPVPLLTHVIRCPAPHPPSREDLSSAGILGFALELCKQRAFENGLGEVDGRKYGVAPGWQVARDGVLAEEFVATACQAADEAEHEVCAAVPQPGPGCLGHLHEHGAGATDDGKYGGVGGQHRPLARRGQGRRYSRRS